MGFLVRGCFKSCVPVCSFTTISGRCNDMCFLIVGEFLALRNQAAGVEVGQGHVTVGRWRLAALLTAECQKPAF